MKIIFLLTNDSIYDKIKSNLTKRNWHLQRRCDLHRIQFLASSALQIIILFVIVLTIPRCHSWKSFALVSLPSSSSSSSLSSSRNKNSSNSNRSVSTFATLSSTFAFPNHRPVLAIITETDACHTVEKMERSFEAIRKAVSTNQVDLVSVRLLSPPSLVGNENNDNNNDEVVLFDQRACTLTEKLVQLSEQQQHYQHIEDQKKGDNNTTSTFCSLTTSFRVVCSSNLVSVAVRGRAHGIHVKERHLDQIPYIIDQFDYPIIIGTSVHCVESALKSYLIEDDDVDVDNNEHYSNNRGKNVGNTTTGTTQRPHYYFVGTCYTTASHPEKTNPNDLEGPELPGRVKQALSSLSTLQLQLPCILAIGGIDHTNCHEPIVFGADGVAVIRAVLQAEHPANIVEQMQSNMMMIKGKNNDKNQTNDYLESNRSSDDDRFR